MLDTPAPRRNPLRKPKGFEPTVQRWSVALPRRCEDYLVAFHGMQAPSMADIDAADFAGQLEAMFSRPDGPIAHDHARHIDDEGQATHIAAAYWIEPERKRSWEASPDVSAFWADPAKRRGPCGWFRESLRVPVGRQESIYWLDYPAALSKSDEVALYPTPYCGYYGAMRDRLPLAATEDLPPAIERLTAVPARPTKGVHLRVRAPANLAVIRSAAAWGACDAEQFADFRKSLRAPLERGMDYLRSSPEDAGCCSLRYQTTVDAAGSEFPETHALGYFLSLSHLEDWAERHVSHHAIFSAAIARYKKYGAANQLRTWHEVYVLPGEGQGFEYINCSPRTGLLPWFEAELLD